MRLICRPGCFFADRGAGAMSPLKQARQYDTTATFVDIQAFASKSEMASGLLLREATA